LKQLTLMEVLALMVEKKIRWGDHIPRTLRLTVFEKLVVTQFGALDDLEDDNTMTRKIISKISRVIREAN
jgi:hypothetical protein